MWHRFGVRYNTVLPGFIETPTTDSIPEEVKEQVYDQYATTGRRLLGQIDICLLVFFFFATKSFFYNLQLLLNLRPSWGPSLPFLCKSLLLWNLFPWDTVNHISSPYSLLSNKPPPSNEPPPRLVGEESYRKPPSSLLSPIPSPLIIPH